MFKIIEKNKDFIIVTKPADIGFHDYDEGNGFFTTVRDTLKSELYPVHRLDRITSGIILFARNKEAAHKLAEQFKMREVQKYYIALSDRSPDKKNGKVSGGMEKTPKGHWILTRKSLNFSTTLYTSQKLKNGLTLFVLRPLTGRTHQIRVALKSLGTPIIGDPLYTSTSGKYDRGYLHAWFLSFRFKGRRYTFSELPETGIFFTDPAFREAITDKTTPEAFPFLNKH